MSLVLEHRWCACGQRFRCESSSDRAQCSACDELEARSAPLARFSRCRGIFDAATKHRHFNQRPCRADQVIAVCGDELGPDGPERDRLVGAIVADINGRPADVDPFDGIAPIRHSGRFYGRDYARTVGP